MKLLILETSSEKSGILLAVDGTPLAFHQMGGGPELSKNLGLETDKLLTTYKFKPHLIAVGAGPGSFTGIRVGAALAKGLALSWNIPVTGFCSLIPFIPDASGPFAVLADAKRGNFYALFGSREKEKITFGKAELIPNTDPRLKQSQAILTSETGLNLNLLSHLVYKQFLEQGPIPLELTYLTSP